MTRIRIKELSFQDQQNQFYHLYGVIEITSDEHKTLTKISMCNLSQQFPQTSAHFGHDKIRNLASSHFHNWWRIPRHLDFIRKYKKEENQHQDLKENKRITIGFVLNFTLFLLYALLLET